MRTVPLGESVRRVAWVCRAEDAPWASAEDLVSDRPNRWNAEGEPTIYVSGDAALALIESGRHPEDVRTTSRLLRVELRLQRALDLRRRDVRTRLELPEDDAWALDRDRTRELATQLRRSGAYDGLIVPSAGALDQVDRWNAVIFADDPAAVTGLVGDLRPVGRLTLGEDGVVPKEQTG